MNAILRALIGAPRAALWGERHVGLRLFAPASTLFALAVLLLAFQSALHASPRGLGLLADFRTDGCLGNHGAQPAFAGILVLQLTAVQVAAVQQFAVTHKDTDGNGTQAFQGGIVKPANVHRADAENGGGAGLVDMLTTRATGGGEAPFHVLRTNPRATTQIDGPGWTPRLGRWRWRA